MTIARPDEIRKNARKSLKIYEKNQDYLWLVEQIGMMDEEEIKETGIRNVVDKREKGSGTLKGIVERSEKRGAARRAAVHVRYWCNLISRGTNKNDGREGDCERQGCCTLFVWGSEEGEIFFPRGGEDLIIRI